MLTRCPQCETIFRVSKKHISAAKGLVRCGSCKDIFNAKEHVIKSKKDLKKPVTTPKPSTPPVPEPTVAKTTRDPVVSKESNGFDFINDGFTSTGEFNIFEKQNPIKNKKSTSKSDALQRGTSSNLNFDSVFEGEAPKVVTEDVFVIKKPSVPKSNEAPTRPKEKAIQKKEGKTPATFNAKTLQPHQATVVKPIEEKKSNAASNFISQNVIDIKNAFTSISKKISTKVTKKVQPEKQSDEVVKKSLENKLNKVSATNQVSPSIIETQVTSTKPTPVVAKVLKKTGVMSLDSDTNIFRTPKTKNKTTKDTNKQVISNKTKIEDKVDLNQNEAKVKAKTPIQKISSPKIKATPKLKEDAALKLAIQLKKAAQEKKDATTTKTVAPKKSTEQKINLKPTEKLKAKPKTNSSSDKNLIDLTLTIKPELEKITIKPSVESTQSAEPKLKLVESEKTDDSKGAVKQIEQKSETSDDKKPGKKEAELISKGNSDENIDDDDDDELEDGLVHVHMQTMDIPMVLRESLEELDLPTRSIEMTLFMIASIVVLCLGLLLQFTVFRSIEVQQNYPSLKPFVTKVCKTFSCDYSGPRDIKKIQLISRDIRVHPTTKGALLISATIINNASYQQPYPNFSVKLSNLGAKTIAQRFFSPKDYLGKLSNKLLLMPPEQPIRVALEVVDPGKAAINFEFKFISRK